MRSSLAKAVRSPTLMTGALLVAIMLFLAVAAPLLTNFDPTKVNYREVLEAPSRAHLLGTDEHGRDIWTRVLFGSRVTLMAAIVAVAISTLAGVFLGMTAGFFGGTYDYVVSRIMDAFFGFPIILLAILLVTVLGPSATAAMIAIGVTRIPFFVRVSRSAVLAEKEKDYVEASRALDSPWSFILFRGILPNAMGPITVVISLGFARAVLYEAALSFLGLGAQPPKPSWGLMLNAGREYLTKAPWYSIAPGVAIVLLVLGLNLVGDGLQDIVGPQRQRHLHFGSANGSRKRRSRRAEADTPARQRPPATDAPLLALNNLTTTFFSPAGNVQAVRGISLELKRGEVLGLVGESGCGKTTTGLSVMRLVPPPASVSGQILWQGANLLDFSTQEMRDLRGNRIAMVFQNPLTSLNPIETVGYQIEQAIRVHRPHVSAADRRKRVEELLSLVGLPDPKERMGSYPHEASGGMRQRMVIAMALANEPDLLIADEPTTALDVSIQAQILWLLEDLQKRLNMAMIYITHDLAVAGSLCDRIAVMYAGEIVESGPVENIFDNPAHPYTQGLMAARPDTYWRDRRLQGIPGRPPSLRANGLHGCSFAPRCPLVMERCRRESPATTRLEIGHSVRCYAA